MRCFACHQPVGANARFCSACGASLQVATPVQHTRPAQLPPSAVELGYAPAELAYAPHALPSYGPQGPALRMAADPFVPAPAPLDDPGAPFGYATSGGMPLGYAPAPVPAPLGYAFAPAPVPAPPPTPLTPPAPSMVNNVMVTQAAPSAPAPTIVVDARGGAGTVARAAFFLLTGVMLGALWVVAAMSPGSAAVWALLFVAAATVAVLLLDIAILNRYPHRR